MSTRYLLEGQQNELERLRLQSLVWEPSGRRLLEGLSPFRARRAVDLGCGCLGWLRLLSEWVGPEGEVVGTDVDERLLDLAQDFVDDEGLVNARLTRDDIFDSALDTGTFDLVHARFQSAARTRASHPVDDGAAARTGWAAAARGPGQRELALQPARTSPRGAHPPHRGRVPALRRRVRRGSVHRTSLRDAGFETSVRSEVIALQPGHPYLALPLQFSSSLEPRLVTLADSVELDRLRTAAASELADDERWGTTFTLLQTVGWRDTAQSLNDPGGH